MSVYTRVDDRDLAALLADYALRLEIGAEPVTFGLKLAGYHAEFQRAKERLAMARFEIATCAISGAVATARQVQAEAAEQAAQAQADKNNARMDIANLLAPQGISRGRSAGPESENRFRDRPCRSVGDAKAAEKSTSHRPTRILWVYRSV